MGECRAPRVAWRAAKASSSRRAVLGLVAAGRPGGVGHRRGGVWRRRTRPRSSPCWRSDCAAVSRDHFVERGLRRDRAAVPPSPAARTAKRGARMIRLFVAIALPDSVADGLVMLQGGIPGARWSTREQLHLTLRFIGEVDGRDAAAIDDALAAIRSPRFSLELKGVGEFGGRNPRALWAGVRDEGPVVHLQRKI